MEREDGRRIVEDAERYQLVETHYLSITWKQPNFFKHHIIFGFLGKFSDGIHFIGKVKEMFKHDFNIELVGTVTAHLRNAALNDDLKTEKDLHYSQSPILPFFFFFFFEVGCLKTLNCLAWCKWNIQIVWICNYQLCCRLHFILIYSNLLPYLKDIINLQPDGKAVSK